MTYCNNPCFVLNPHIGTLNRIHTILSNVLCVLSLALQDGVAAGEPRETHVSHLEAGALTFFSVPPTLLVGCKEIFVEEDHAETELSTGKSGLPRRTSPLWTCWALLAKINFAEMTSLILSMDLYNPESYKPSAWSMHRGLRCNLTCSVWQEMRNS